MSGEYQRYAVYWVPRRPDPLAVFGASWTGWCAEQGEVRPRGAFPGLAAEAAAVTRGLHCHGLHAAIRAPFRLAPGRSGFSVEHVLTDLAEELVAAPLPPLETAVLAGRVALVPTRTPRALAALMTRVAEALRPLAADTDANGNGNGFAEAPAARDATLVPLPGAGAPALQVPLTDPLPEARARALEAGLASLLAPMLVEPRRLAELALMGDPGGGRPLRVLQRYELLDRPRRHGAEALPCYGPRVYAPMPAERRSAGATV